MSKFLKKILIPAAINQIFLYTLPFGLWAYAFRTFYSAQTGLKLVADARLVFVAINTYLNNLLRGVYPMWNPYNVWGRPDEHVMRAIGELNPFYYVILLLKTMGLSFSLAYFIFFLGYFFLGIFGFYQLAKVVFSDNRKAYIAMVLLLFTSLGTNLFNDILVILIFVPGIWFFYFLAAFSNEQKTVNLLGMTFTLMLLMITYIPFIFFTVLLTVGFFFVLLYPYIFFQLVKRSFAFFRKKKILAILCLLSLVLSAIPGLLYSQASQSGEYVATWRDHDGEKADTINLKIEEIDRGGGIIGSLSLERFFSELDIIPHLGFIYVPIFWILIVSLGIIVPLHKRIVLYLFISFFLFAISLGGVFPVHKFLFDHFPFIRSFRNIHFFIWFAMPVFILFLIEQLDYLMNFSFSSRIRKGIFIFFLSTIHLFYFVFLSHRPHVISSTFVVIILSYLFFLFETLGLLQERKSLAMVFLLGIIVLQPLEVYKTVVYNSRGCSSAYSLAPYTKEQSIPAFRFQRPHLNSDKRNQRKSGFQDVFDFNIKDTSGFLNKDTYYHGLRWAYALQLKIPPNTLADYVVNKFILYTHVQYVDEGAINYYKLQKAFAENQDLAYVEGVAPKEQINAYQKGEKVGEAEILTQEDASIKILHFDINSIKFQTDFPTQKFLVYNDTYHSDWFASLNSKKTRVYKANGAFKGFWIPSGKQVVSLRFRSLSRYALIDSLLLVFILYLVYFVSFYFYQLFKAMKR